MPTFRLWYNRKPPTLQIKILKCIAVNGQMSKKKCSAMLGANYPDVSDAIKVLAREELIVFSFADLKNSRRPEQYYKVTDKGLGAFIEVNPSLREFWNGIIWFIKLSKKRMDTPTFEWYYNRFEQMKIGEWSVRGGYFQLYFFDRILDEWLKSNKLGKYRTGEAGAVPLSQKILECLALNRAITLDQLVEEIRKVEHGKFRRFFPRDDFDPSLWGDSVSYERIKTVLNAYVPNATDYFTNIYRPDDYDSDNLIERYLGFVRQFIIVSKEPDGENCDSLRYELSLSGVILILSIISRQYSWSSTNRDFQNDFLYSRMGLYDYYDKIALNYHDKLPLIFGKWDLLKKKTPDMVTYFNVILYDDIRSDLMSVPILMDGNKEIYENIHALALYTNSKLLEIYNDALSVLEEEEHAYDEQSIKRKYSELVNKKLTEIEALISYADLNMFSKGLQQKKDKLQLREIGTKDLNIVCSTELAILEKVLGEEINLLFYSNLSKESHNYLLQFHPPHSLFLERENEKAGTGVSSIVAPRSMLLSILGSDNDIKVWFSKRVKDSLIYHRKTLDVICDLYTRITGEKLEM